MLRDNQNIYLNAKRRQIDDVREQLQNPNGFEKSFKPCSDDSSADEAPRIASSSTANVERASSSTENVERASLSNKGTLFEKVEDDHLEV